jgi:hypothetical protein
MITIYVTSNYLLFRVGVELGLAHKPNNTERRSQLEDDRKSIVTVLHQIPLGGSCLGEIGQACTRSSIHTGQLANANNIPERKTKTTKPFGIARHICEKNIKIYLKSVFPNLFS